MMPGPERPEGSPRRDGEIGEECRRCRCQDIPIASCVSHHDKDMLESAISQLQHDPPDLGLSVYQARLSLDR